MSERISRGIGPATVVSADHDAIDGAPHVYLGEHRLERRKVPVNVEECCDSHCTTIRSPRRVLVLGLARSGEAAALALARRGVAVVAVDRDGDQTRGRLREAGVEVVVGADDPALLEGMDLMVKSPGVPARGPARRGCARRAHPCGARSSSARGSSRTRILGVTGTNGKTTTSELLGAIFRAAGQPVSVAGNVGRPLTRLDGIVPADTWVVCELSSFQLEDIESFRPQIAVLLNVTLDHLDRHGTFDDYATAKLRIFENQTPRTSRSCRAAFPRSPARLAGWNSPRPTRCRPSLASPANTTGRTRPLPPQRRGPPASTMRNRRGAADVPGRAASP